MSDAYDPRSAYLGLQQGLKTLQSQATAAQPPVGLIDVHGAPVSAQVDTAPKTCCVLLMAFMHRHPMVPDDFHNVPRTKAGIEAYVRPDGAIYLGAYELPKDPFGTVLVWGDPALTQAQVAAASIAYRKKVVDTAMGLGPFSATPKE